MGIGRNIFSLDYDLNDDLLFRYWINHFWNFAHEYGISLPTSPNQLDLHREGDIFPMEQLSQSRFTPRQIKNMNRCQLYLQIHTLSDISNGHGNYFDKGYYDGHQYEISQATYSWPDQGYPGPKEWQLWRKVIKKCFLNDNNSTYLDKLGKWIDNH